MINFTVIVTSDISKTISYTVNKKKISSTSNVSNVTVFSIFNTFYCSPSSVYYGKYCNRVKFFDKFSI